MPSSFACSPVTRKWSWNKSQIEKKIAFWFCSKLLCLQEFVTNLLYQFTVPFNPSTTNPTKWSNTLKQFVGNSQQLNYLSVFDQLVGLALKGLRNHEDFYKLFSRHYKLVRNFFFSFHWGYEDVKITLKSFTTPKLAPISRT